MNAKHQFKYTYNEGCEEFSPVEITVEIPGEVTLTQMLYNFECYLKSCGFVFDGHLEVVDEDTCAVLEDAHGCCMGDTDEDECCEEKDNKWLSAQKNVEEWNRRLDELEKKVRRKNNSWYEKDHTEVEKQKWVQGMCNPPSPDWDKNDPDNCWNS